MPPEEREVVASNRKAHFDYHIEDVWEAGLVLTGTEVKSLRAGKAQIRDAYGTAHGNEIWLINSYIEEYKQGNRFNHHPTRHRKLLLKAREVKKIIGSLKVKGVTLIPLNLYFNARGIAKIEIGLATGKKKYEKRDAIKERDWKREQSRIMKKGDE